MLAAAPARIRNSKAVKRPVLEIEWVYRHGVFAGSDVDPQACVTPKL